MTREGTWRSFAAFVVGLLAVGVGLVFVIVRIRSQWDEFQKLIAGANWLLLATAVLVGLLAMVTIGTRWHRCMLMLGAAPEGRDAGVWFGTGQLGKYVPGGVWHVVGQGELARRSGIPRAVSYGSVLFATVSLMGAAALVTSVGALMPGGVRPVWWVVPVGLLITALSWEPGLFRRLNARVGLSRIPTRRDLIGFGLGNVTPWAGVAAATVLCARSLDSNVAVVAVGFAAVGSWLIGFLALPAPGGLGVREAAFVLLLEGQVDSTLAASVAVVARVVFLMADLGLFFAVAARSRRAVGFDASPAPPSTDSA